MDIFRTLAGGGASFDKKRFQNDLKIFGGGAAADEASTSGHASPSGSGSGKRKRGGGDAAESAAGGKVKREEKDASGARGEKVIVPDGLDFFGSAAKSKSTTSAVEREERLSRKEGKRKADVEVSDSESDDDEDGEEEEEKEESEDEPPVTKATLSSFLKKHKIKLKGTDVPLPMSSWGELESRFNVSPWLRTNLEKYGWGIPTAIQKGAMPVLLANRDLLAGAPTGSGKTLAFLLPLIHHLRAPSKKENFRAVIVSPTRELAQQIYDQLRRLSEGRNFRICVLTKTADASSIAASADASTRKKFDILITTPLRLVHAVEKEEVDLSNVRHLVLDEADRLLEEGFLQQTDSILAACSHPHLRKALFSATLPAGVEEMAKTFMIDECRIIVGTKDSATETIKQELQFVGSEDGKLHALRSLIQQGGLKPPVLLFVQSIERAKDLFHELVYDGLHVDVIHSERPKVQREGVISAFKRGDVWVLICTELMARGIDFKGVQLVINYDFPQSVQSYIHRIGRTGRAGREGRAITYFTKEDAGHLKTVVNVMRQSGCEVPQWMLGLKNPNKKERRRLKQRAPERKEIRTSAASSVGRRAANKRKDMIAASKRRKMVEGQGLKGKSEN